MVVHHISFKRDTEKIVEPHFTVHSSTSTKEDRAPLFIIHYMPSHNIYY